MRMQGTIVVVAALSLLHAAVAPSGADVGRVVADELKEAVLDLLSAPDSALRRGVPPSVLRPFVEASRNQGRRVNHEADGSAQADTLDEASDPAWRKWLAGLRGALEATAGEMAEPTAQAESLRRLGLRPERTLDETAKAFEHRTQGPTVDRARIKALYDEPTMERDDYPEAESVASYAELLKFLESDRFHSYFEQKRPLLIRGRNERLMLNVTMEQALFGADAKDFVYGMQGTLWHHRTVSFAQGGFHRLSTHHATFAQITSKELSKALQQGSTAVYDGVGHWQPEVARLASDLSRVFAHLTNVNMCDHKQSLRNIPGNTWGIITRNRVAVGGSPQSLCSQHLDTRLGLFPPTLELVVVHVLDSLVAWPGTSRQTARKNREQP